MAKLTNGRVTVEVPDEKAEKYALVMGYRIVQDEVKEEAAKPVAKRGRPRKAE